MQRDSFSHKQIPVPHLEKVVGVLPYRVIPVSSDSFSIGRGRQNDLQILDTTVSRTHASLRRAQGVWFVQDRGSRNGILLNGQPVMAGRVKSRDQITIGRNTFIFWER